VYCTFILYKGHEYQIKSNQITARWKCGEIFVARISNISSVIGESAKFLRPITPSIKHALSAEIGRLFCCPKVPNMRYRWKCGEFVAHNSKYQTYVIGWNWATLLWPKCALLVKVRRVLWPLLQVSNIGYRLKFSDAFAAQTFPIPNMRICESAAKFLWPIKLQVSNMRYRQKLGDAFVAQKYQICVIGESAASFVAHNSKYQTYVIGWNWATLLWPKSTKYALPVKVRRVLWSITPSIKRRLSTEVWRRFCGPKVPNMRYRWKCGEFCGP